MTNFDKIYRTAIEHVYTQGEDVYSERTGVSTKALPGYTFDMNPSHGFPLLTLRKIPVKLFVAEVVWMITGKKHLEFLRRYTKVWDEFAEDDGTVQAAYGHRWRNYFGRDQLIDLITHLHEEPSSRQAVVMMWDPATDGLRAPKRKNVPCPFTWVGNIIGGKFNLHLIIRSNDMMLGNPHDTAGFALLQAIIAQELGVEVGKFTLSISHAHIYGNHFEQAEELLTREDHVHDEIMCKLPEKTFLRALAGDAHLVDEITTMFREQYNPAPSVKRMQVAL
jgi:thymidylate synthase